MKTIQCKRTTSARGIIGRFLISRFCRPCNTTPYTFRSCESEKTGEKKREHNGSVATFAKAIVVVDQN